MTNQNISLYRQKWTDPKTGNKCESPYWSYVIHFAGKRYRGATKQTKKTLAWNYARGEQEKLERAYAGLPVEAAEQRIRTVTEALAEYETTYKANHRERAYDLVRDRAQALRKHLGASLLAELTERKIGEYISQRRTEGVGPRTTNIEVGILARAMGQTRRYLWPKLKPLREPKDVGRALSPEEEAGILNGARENCSPYIRLAVTIALTTGMRRGEIEGLRWGQVDFSRNEIRVGEAKTEKSEGRVIPMNADLRAAIDMHSSWFALKFGEIGRDLYLFPFCNTKKPIDPTRPVTSLKTAWNSVRAAAGVQCRFHDLRHTAASRMGRAGISRAAMMRVLGHASQSLVDRYCHAEERDVRAAVEALQLTRVEDKRHSDRHSDRKQASVGSNEVILIQ